MSTPNWSRTSSGSSTPNFSSPSQSPDIQRALQIYHNKQAYNKWYYENKTKPRKVQEKALLSSLPDIEYLTNQVQSLTVENNQLRESYEALLRKNNELMKIYASSILPSIGQR